MRAPVIVLLGAILAAPTGASAQLAESIERTQSFSTPQRFAFEVKFGPYTPNIDSEFSSSPGPYASYFGGDDGLMSQLELDWQLFQRFGTLAVGLGWGYFSKSAKSFPCLSGGGYTCEPNYDNPSGDETSISIMPLSLLAVYRFDVGALRLSIPLVPYAKIGLTYSFWWINKGNGKVAEVEIDGDVQHARGAQLGLTTVFGVALMLDALDPGAGRELDGYMGINHTYLFWEWAWWGADGFGSSNALNIGDSTWSAGLAFEM